MIRTLKTSLGFRYIVFTAIGIFSFCQCFSTLVEFVQDGIVVTRHPSLLRSADGRAAVADAPSLRL